MLTKAALASKSDAKQETYPHSNFEDKNHIGAKRGGRFKKCFYQQIISTQTTDCVPFRIQTRVPCGRAVEFILAMGRGSAGRTSAERRKDFMGLSRDPHLKPQMFLQTRFDVTPQSPYALVVESLPPITGHAANSRQDSRAFSNPFASFLFTKITLCIFAVPPFSPASAMHA